jgi:streptogramin lyase
MADRPRLRVLLAGSTVALAIAAAVVWWWQSGPRPLPPLQRNWPALVRTVAGNTNGTTEDGLVTAAGFGEPFGVAVSQDGVIYVADGGSHRIRRITLDGRIETVAGGTRGFADGRAAAASFDTPSGIARDSKGVLYVADTGNHAIRRITPDGFVSTLAGDGTPGATDSGTPRFNGPIGIAVDASGRVIVADTYNDRIRAISSDGSSVATIAGG